MKDFFKGCLILFVSFLGIILLDFLGKIFS